MICFYLLLSVVPQYATSIGASGIGAGFATGALMLSTVATELATPRIVARFGYRLTLATGLALLGAPAFALIAAHTMPAILAISLVRGAGLAIVVVVGGSLVASITPAERRGEGLGLYGFIVNIPAIVGLPLGVWLAAHAGFPTVFVIAALAALWESPRCPDFPRGAGPHTRSPSACSRDCSRPRSRAPRSYSPQPRWPPASSSPSFRSRRSTHPRTSSPPRCSSRPLRRRPLAGTPDITATSTDPPRCMIPGVLLAAIGMSALVFIGSHAGDSRGHGALRHRLRHHAERDAHDHVRARVTIGLRRRERRVERGLRRWAGLGAVVFGFVSTHTGYPVAFAILAAFMLAMLAPALYDRATPAIES